MSSRGSKVPAATHTLRILRFLSERRGPVAASRIAAALELPRSTVYHLLAVMADEGFVLHVPSERAYGLGIAAFELSSAYSRQEPLSRLGRPLLGSLVDRVGHSAHLAVLHGHDVYYIVEERARHRPSLVTDVGVRLPAHITATGRAILAALPRAQVRALYPAGYAFTARHPTDTPITDYAALRRVLDAVIQRGHAVEDGDVTPHFASVAVPVLDHAGWPAAAVAVTFGSNTLDDDALLAVLREIRRAAASLARSIDGSPR